jgi:hypothetical protein
MTISHEILAVFHPAYARRTDQSWILIADHHHRRKARAAWGKRDAEGARFGRCEIDEVAWERVSDATAMLADSAGYAYSTPQQLRKLDSDICANRRVSYLRMRHGDCDTVRPRGGALPLFANPDCARIGIVSGMIGVDIRSLVGDRTSTSQYRPAICNSGQRGGMANGCSPFAPGRGGGALALTLTQSCFLSELGLRPAFATVAAQPSAASRRAGTCISAPGVSCRPINPAASASLKSWVLSETAGLG